MLENLIDPETVAREEGVSVEDAKKAMEIASGFMQNLDQAVFGNIDQELAEAQPQPSAPANQQTAEHTNQSTGKSASTPTANTEHEPDSNQIVNMVNNFVSGLTGKTPAELAKEAQEKENSSHV